MSWVAMGTRYSHFTLEERCRLRVHVEDRLAMGWFPEQIAGRMELEGGEHRTSAAPPPVMRRGGSTASVKEKRNFVVIETHLFLNLRYDGF